MNSDDQFASRLNYWGSDTIAHQTPHTMLWHVLLDTFTDIDVGEIRNAIKLVVPANLHTMLDTAPHNADDDAFTTNLAAAALALPADALWIEWQSSRSSVRGAFLTQPTPTEHGITVRPYRARAEKRTAATPFRLTLRPNSKLHTVEPINPLLSDDPPSRNVAVISANSTLPAIAGLALLNCCNTTTVTHHEPGSNGPTVARWKTLRLPTYDQGLADLRATYVNTTVGHIRDYPFDDHPGVPLTMWSPQPRSRK